MTEKSNVKVLIKTGVSSNKVGVEIEVTLCEGTELKTLEKLGDDAKQLAWKLFNERNMEK